MLKVFDEGDSGKGAVAALPSVCPIVQPERADVSAATPDSNTCKYCNSDQIDLFDRWVLQYVARTGVCTEAQGEGEPTGNWRHRNRLCQRWCTRQPAAREAQAVPDVNHLAMAGGWHGAWRAAERPQARQSMGGPTPGGLKTELRRAGCA